MKKILIISVHPDDETLGCGGTILKHKRNGDSVSWLILTTPTIENPCGYPLELIKKRHTEIDIVTQKYGFDKTYNLFYPPRMLERVNLGELINKVDDVISNEKPHIIYLHNYTDVHSDHKIAFDAVYACTKNFRKPFIERILIYETLSETEFAPPYVQNNFIPNVFVDISDFIDQKIEIMQVYESEIMPDNLPRSTSAIKSLAGYRGSRISVSYAEAFMLIFEKL